MSALNPAANQTRAYHCRASADTSQRIVFGIGVPLETEVEIFPGFREVFDQDCVFENIDRAKLKTGHQTLIGVLESHSREPGELAVEMRASRTPAGDEALTLAADGALDSFSIGFRFMDYDETPDDNGGFLIRHKRVHVIEFSLTDDPVYPTAQVTDVRERSPQPSQEGNPMPENTITAEDLDGIRSAQDEQAELLREMQVQFATLGEERGAPQPRRFASFGEFVRAYHSASHERHADAVALHRDWNAAATDVTLHNERAFDGTVLADTIARDPWVGDSIKLIDRGRRVLNSFQHAPLPATGNRIEHGVLESNTVQVGKQAAEGDDLVKGEIKLGTDSAAVGTYGGWSALSFQAVERSDISVLNLTRRAQLIAYAQQTEAEVRTVLQQVMTDQLAVGHNFDLPAAAKAADWVALMIDAHDAYDDAAAPIDGLYLSKDKFIELFTLADTNGRLQFTVSGTGSNVVGNLQVQGVEGPSGDVANTRVRLLPGSEPGRGAFYNGQAITTWENAGAPVALEDKNVVNLTSAYSVYGYLACAAEMPDLITPIEFAV